MPKKTDAPVEPSVSGAGGRKAGSAKSKAAAPAEAAEPKRSKEPVGTGSKAKKPPSSKSSLAPAPPAKEEKKTPRPSRAKVPAEEQKTEKTLAKKNPLGKIAKAVTDQVNALAKKVTGKGTGEKKLTRDAVAKAAPDVASEAVEPVKPKGRKAAAPDASAEQAAAAKVSVTPVQSSKPTKKLSEASVKPPVTPSSKAEASVDAGAGSGQTSRTAEGVVPKKPAAEPAGKVSASRSAVAKAASAGADEKPIPQKPAKQAGIASTPDAAASLTGLTGSERAAKPEKPAAGKKASSRKGAQSAADSDPSETDKTTDTEELIRSEQEISAPSPSDVREHIFHERYAHVPSPPPRDLPHEYGDTRIVLLVRDPEWVYAYWEVNDSTRQELRIPRSGHNRRMVVRLYKITGRNWPEDAASYFFDVEVSPYAQNWYIKLPETAQQWCAELGMFNEEGDYLPIIRSNAISTPRDSVSPETDADWMTVEEVYEKLYGISAGYAAANAVLRGAAGPGASEQLLRHFQRQISTGLRGQIDMSSSGLFSGSSESVTAAARGAVAKDFWLQVHTELILYGSTEPDAAVTVQGRPVKLNPDGTFSLRYALPDGEQVLRVQATNRDGDMEREVTPVVTRTTRKKS